MAMTRSQMAAHVTLNLGNRTGFASQITDWLNWSLQDTVAIRNWRQMKILDITSLRSVAGRAYYSLPLGIKDIIDLRYAHGVMGKSLTYKPIEVFRKQFPHPEDDGGGDPVFYTRQGDYLMFYPFATEDNIPIEAFWVIMPNDMLADNTICPLAGLEKAIISQATGYGYAALGEPDRKGWWEQQWWKHCKREARNDGDFSDWTLVYASERLGAGGAGRPGLCIPTFAVGEEIITV